MKIIPVLAAAVIATFGVGSAAQAAIIDFGVSAVGGTPGVSYTGATLQGSSAFNFDGATLAVTSILPGDSSGLALFDVVHLAPTMIVYGSGSGMMDIDIGNGPIEKKWTGAGGDMFTETLDKVTLISRSTNAIAVTLSGTLTDTLGMFMSSPVDFVLTANQARGPGNAIQAGFTNASSAVVPETATWVMMGLGFAALGYAAVRRSSKDRSAVAMI